MRTPDGFDLFLRFYGFKTEYETSYIELHGEVFGDPSCPGKSFGSGEVVFVKRSTDFRCSFANGVAVQVPLRVAPFDNLPLRLVGLNVLPQPGLLEDVFGRIVAEYDREARLLGSSGHVVLDRAIESLVHAITQLIDDRSLLERQLLLSQVEIERLTASLAAYERVLMDQLRNGAPPESKQHLVKGFKHQFAAFVVGVTAGVTGNVVYSLPPIQAIQDAIVNVEASSQPD